MWEAALRMGGRGNDAVTLQGRESWSCMVGYAKQAAIKAWPPFLRRTTPLPQKPPPRCPLPDKFLSSSQSVCNPPPPTAAQSVSYSYHTIFPSYSQPSFPHNPSSTLSSSFCIPPSSASRVCNPVWGELDEGLVQNRG